MAPGSQALAVRAVCYGPPEVTRIALKTKQRLPARAVPYPHPPVVADRSQTLAVRAEREAADSSSVGLDRERHLAGGAVPDLHCAVPTRRGQPLAVRAE